MTAPGQGSRPKIVLLGMMTKMPVAGVVWQNLHYLLGFERLGYETYYVETHGRTPSMLMSRPEDDSSALAAEFIAAIMRRFGLADRWAFHALHDDGRCFGMSEIQLERLYQGGGAADQPSRRHPAAAGARRDRPPRIPRDRPGPAAARAAPRAGGDARLPRAALRLLHLRGELRQPRLRPAAAGPLSASCRLASRSWSTSGRTVRRSPLTSSPRSGTGARSGATSPSRASATAGASTTSSSSSSTCRGAADRRSSSPCSSCEPADCELLARARAGGSATVSRSRADIDRYRDYIGASRGEFTVAKDQNVRLRTGWFSDRSATYLAAGRPVVTQDTGFGSVLPTGEGLFGFDSPPDERPRR